MTFHNQAVSPSCSRAKKTPVLSIRYSKPMFPAVPPVKYRYNKFWDLIPSILPPDLPLPFNASLDESAHVISKG